MPTPTAKLPLEVIDLIVDYVGTNDLNHKFCNKNRNIKACSLVSRSLLPRARMYIFSSIVIWYMENLKWTPFERLISLTPVIAYYVTSLHCHIDGYYLDQLKESNIEHLVRALNSLTRLKSLTLSFHDDISWKDLKIIKEPLLNLMHLPTLCSLTLHEPYEFQLSDLTLCVGLKHLVTGYMDPSYLGHIEVGESVEIYQEEPSRLESFDGSAPTRIVHDVAPTHALLQLCTACRADGRPIVDVTGLRKLCLRISHRTALEGMWELFKHLHQLTSLEMFGYDQLYDELDDSSLYYPPHLFLPSLLTLQHVHLDINNGSTYMLVAGFTSITGSIDYDDDWSRLDQVFTHSDSQFGWEKLKLFSLQATVHFNETVDNRDKSMEELRMQLVTKLKGLASSNTIVLDLKVSPYRPW